MNTQLDFCLDSESSRNFQSIYNAVDQESVIQELIRLYLDFIKIKKEEKTDDGKH